MRPDFESIGQQGLFNNKIVTRPNRPNLSAAWHFHPEVEICYTERSSGRRYVGNKISYYQEHDLVLLGENLPHGFTTQEECKQYVIQFRKEFLGSQFLRAAESKEILDLIEKASLGIEILGEAKQQSILMIKDIIQNTGVTKLIKLLELLSYLATIKDCTVICDREYSSSVNVRQLGRIKKVLDFIEEHYQNDISIADAAQVINLTESAFYKFIMRHKKKKFTHILNEFRINHASKLLTQTQMTIAEICFDSGYRNLSYFNRKFKEFTKVSPSVFRSKYR